jgi:IPT/TIG domain
MAPVISSINPTSGPTAGGNTVTISGSSFSGAISVKFGTTGAAFVLVNGGEITATAPAGSGSVVVTVTTPAGTSNGVTYTYISAPVISGLSPVQGPAAGGNTVAITGTNLAGAASVMFGSLPATITGSTSTQVTVTAPAVPAGAVAVSVTTPGGTSNPLPYYSITAPAVISVDPSMGPTAGGNTTTITGSGLTLAQAARFGASAATNISVISDNQITAVAPVGTGTVTVSVTTPGGASLAGSPGNPYYTYVPAPVITALSPAQGPASGGQTVTITGSKLTYTGTVRFGGTPASFTTVSDIYVVATAPSGTAGSATVTVQSPGGTSNGLTYQYQP